MAGSIFITQADLADFQADAVVCPTSTYLMAGGFLYPVFASRFPGFEASYEQIRQEHPPHNDRGQRLRIGDAFWIPIAPPAEGRLRGIVLVAVTGGSESIRERAVRSVQCAIRTARVQLRQAHQGKAGDRWLIAAPTIGLGQGGYSRELMTAAEGLIQAAADEIRQPEDVSGKSVEVDVAFVAFTPLNYRLLLDARRAVRAEPPCPLDPSHATNLLDSIRGRRCVLFVGAGLSRGAGLPDWGELLRELAKELGLDDASLPRDANGQIPLDLCLDLAQWYAERIGREKLDSRVRQLFGRSAEEHARVRPTLAHYLLLSMPFRLFLTTNYDDLLERALTALRHDPEVIYTPESVVRTGQTERPSVVKLHGDATHRTPIVLTRDDFDRFFRDYPVITALLQGLLLNHTFFFVGYDLRDPNTRRLYSEVAHLLGTSGTRAYSVVVRGGDVTDAFYEEQWARKGLLTLRMPGPDRIHNSLLFFDWLARQTCDWQTFLHPDLGSHELPAELADLATVRDLMHQLGDQLDVLLAPGRVMDSSGQIRLLAEVLELITRLGWRSHGSRTWERVADLAPDRLDKEYFLRQALASAEEAGDIDQIRARIRALETTVQRSPVATAALYEVDETAWFEATAELIRQGRFQDVDRDTLAEYLADMAKRDRREMFSRLVTLLSHLLKWEHQPDRRSGSWRGTILEQQRELRQLLESGTLRNHATAVFTDAYVDARKQAAAEAGLARTVFPEECAWDLDSALAAHDEDAEPS
jgi:hypothetical protein